MSSDVKSLARTSKFLWKFIFEMVEKDDKDDKGDKGDKDGKGDREAREAREAIGVLKILPDEILRTIICELQSPCSRVKVKDFYQFTAAVKARIPNQAQAQR